MSARTGAGGHVRSAAHGNAPTQALQESVGCSMQGNRANDDWTSTDHQLVHRCDHLNDMQQADLLLGSCWHNQPLDRISTLFEL